MKRWLFLPFLALTLLAGCDNIESARIEETRTKLAGTWLRTSDFENARVRRVLVLSGDGKFIDGARVTTAGRPEERRELAGEWSYDGMNLKRRYLEENGRKFSGGKIRYATFRLLSVDASELVLDDNIEGRKVSYQRVPEGTQP